MSYVPSGRPGFRDCTFEFWETAVTQGVAKLLGVQLGDWVEMVSLLKRGEFPFIKVFADSVKRWDARAKQCYEEESVEIVDEPAIGAVSSAKIEMMLVAKRGKSSKKLGFAAKR